MDAVLLLATIVLRCLSAGSSWCNTRAREWNRRPVRTRTALQHMGCKHAWPTRVRWFMQALFFVAGIHRLSDELRNPDM